VRSARTSQVEHAAHGSRSDLQREHGEQHGEQGGEAQHRNQDGAGPGAAGLRRGHFTVVIEAPQPEHDAQQQTDGQDQGQVLHGAERDELEHHATRVLVLGRPR
jgi:hypothetical protein